MACGRLYGGVFVGIFSGYISDKLLELVGEFDIIMVSNKKERIANE